MKKKEIIKKSNDYTKVINKNNKLKNKYYSLFYIKSDNTLFGISIPKKIGNAVIRNKNKRQIKNIIDNNKNNVVDAGDTIFWYTRSYWKGDNRQWNHYGMVESVNPNHPNHS